MLRVFKSEWSLEKNLHCFQLDAASVQPHVSHHRSDPHDSQDLMPGQPPRLEHGPVFQNMPEEIGDGAMTSSTHETLTS